MFPKSRACRPERAFFSVATPLRWLDMRLPEEINPADGSELLQVFATLWPKFLPCSLSFALAPGVVSQRVALRTLALNFAQPVLERWRRRKEARSN